MYDDHMPRFKNPASCAESDPDMWHDNTARTLSGTQTEHLMMAKRICKQCLALDECKAYAIKYADLPGVWGGQDHIERKEEQTRLNLPTIDWHSTFNTLTIGRFQYE